MTEHEKAILKALIDLDGRGTLQEIYPLARKYAVYEGKTPNNTVRRDLQQSIFVRHVEGTTGQYEFIPFNVFAKAKDAEIARLAAELNASTDRENSLKEELTVARELSTCYENLAQALMSKMAPCDKEDRKDVREALTKIQNWLVLRPSEATAEEINNFVYGKPKAYSSSSKTSNTIEVGKYPFVCKPEKKDAIIVKIHSHLIGKKSPKDIMMPFRAAQDAGAIRRISFEEMQEAFPDYCPGKTSVNDYTNQDKKPFIGEAFDNMVNEFKTIIN